MESSRDNEGGSKKKRVAEKQLRSEDVENDEDENEEEDSGEFKRAKADVIAKRKIVKARRTASKGLVPENIHQAEEPAAPAPAWPTFSFSATASSSNGKAETPKKDENGKEEKASTPSKSTSEDKDKKETPETKKVFGDFSWISKAASESDNKETKSPGSAPLFSFSSFSSNTEKKAPLFPPFESTKSIFSFNVDSKATTGEFPTFSQSPETKREKPNLPPAEPVKTGEEEEQHVYQTRAKLFTMDKSENKWKERGVGNIRVNVSQDGKEARLVMRVDASLRLILNSRIWPNMVVEKAGSKEIRFIGTSILENNEIATFLVRVSKPEMAEELLKSIEDQKKLVSPPKSKEEEKK